MSVIRCPSCGAQVLPGEPSCRRCSYDFILGRKPADQGPLEAARLRRNVALSALAAVLLVAGVGFLFAASRGSTEPEEAPLCQVALEAMQPAVKAAAARGNAIPRCAATPPGPADCWASAGSDPAQYADQGLSFTLRPSAQGFELECARDADGDGKPAVWKANEDIVAVRITGEGVR